MVCAASVSMFHHDYVRGYAMTETSISIDKELLAEARKIAGTTTNQAAIADLFRVIRRYEGNLPPMPGVFPDYPAPVIRNGDDGEREIAMMRWGMPPPPTTRARTGWRAGIPPAGSCRWRPRTTCST